MSSERTWWKDGVFYQIYPRSFRDTNGNGYGDLVGITSELDYLAWLGVDALWISPIYVSPGVDAGYDVADHCDIDPIFGDLEDFDRLIAAAHERDLRVILDWVPNHTSDQHRWFQASRTDPTGPYGDWYWWADEPTNNWPSAFGGPAWTFDEVRGQYYLHLFAPEQPDLKWNSPGVKEAMTDVLRFWLDRGVDGFRADVVHLIGRDPVLRDIVVREVPGLNDLVNHYQDPLTHALLRDIRGVFDSYAGERVMIGEVTLEDTELVIPYLGTAEEPELHLTFDFTLLEAEWDAKIWHDFIAGAENAHGKHGSWPTWVLSNHDKIRHRSRYQGSEDKARAAATVLLTLRGTPFMYAGEELGLEDAVVPPERRHDMIGRDGTRAPIPWTPEVGHGWASSDPWLPWPPESTTRNAATLRDDPNSIVHLYRRLLELRRSDNAFQSGRLVMLDDAPKGSIAYKRIGDDGSEFTIMVNFTDAPLLSPYNGELALCSSDSGCADGVVPPSSAVILTTKSSSSV